MFDIFTIVIYYFWIENDVDVLYIKKDHIFALFSGAPNKIDVCSGSLWIWATSKKLKQILFKKTSLKWV